MEIWLVDGLHKSYVVLIVLYKDEVVYSKNVENKYLWERHDHKNVIRYTTYDAIHYPNYET